MRNPKLVLRVAIAGERNLASIAPTQRAALPAHLAAVYAEIIGCMESLAAGTSSSSSAHTAARFYHGHHHDPTAPPDPAAYPTIRLITGLADGADQLAFRTLEECKDGRRPTRDGIGRRTNYEHVAVLPCDPSEFRDNSAVKNKTEFDDMLRRCSTVIQLDGRCDRSDPTNPLVVKRRARCFRAQSRVLLRQCDVLVAVTDPAKAGGAGGTRQTMDDAFELGVPVILISLSPSHAPHPIVVLGNREHLEDKLEGANTKWRSDVRQLVESTLTDPRIHRRIGGDPLTAKQTDLTSNEVELLREYLGGAPPPAAERGTTANSAADYFEPFHARASTLSRRYAARYRRAFLINYLFATIAVCLAVLSLLAVVVTLHSHEWEEIGIAVLGALALGKLAILFTIYLNTKRANANRWNDKAIDFRYLSERLRTISYLPIVGSLRPLRPKSAQYAAVVLRQNIVDWLFNAIVREAPAGTGLAPLAPSLAAAGAGAGVGVDGPRAVGLDILKAIQTIRSDWLHPQAHYHTTNADRHRAVHERMDRWIGNINFIVILVVVVDLGILAAVAMFAWLNSESARVAWLHTWSPALIALAAFLPAVVASLNGFQFQSESKRLAERSKMTYLVVEQLIHEWRALEQRVAAAAESANDPGAWTLETLDLAEATAQVLTDEVAEWSVLYSRDVSET